MPFRNQTQSRLSARAVYARNAMKVEGPKRGRPRSKKVSEPSERILSEDSKKSKTVVRKRQRSVGKKHSIEKVENNSSEADCSSEGEEMDYTDDERKVDNAGSDGEELDEEEASSESEENSEEEEDSADEAEDSADEADDSADEEENSVENSEDLDEEEEEDLVDEEENLNEEEEDSNDDEEEMDEESEDNENEEVSDEEELRYSLHHRDNENSEESDEEEVRYSLPDPKEVSPEGKKKTNVKNSATHESPKTPIKKKSKDGNLISKRASPDKKKKEKVTTENGEATEHENQGAENRNDDENENLSLQNHVNSDVQQDVRIKTSDKNDLTHTSTKRKIKSEASDEDEDMIQQNGSIPNKQKKKIRTASQNEEDLNEENNRFGSTAPFQRLLNRTSVGSSVNHSNSNSNATGSQKKKRSSTFASSLGPPVSLNKFYESVPCGNVAADEAFRYLLHPTTPEEFFKKEFEISPFQVLRYRPGYYKELFSNEDLNTMMKENNLEYGVHIDVLKYVNGQRVPVEAAGKAYYSNVWEDYKEGYSIRVRNPQAYNKNIWNLCALLQEYFSSSVGVNVYLTPPNAQGFPPHYDDIDAFILQIEGTKHWKVYAPRNQSEDLARYSSIDFKENEIGPVLREFTLAAGDLLYIPRGYIHQASTNEHFHSLHLTFSTNQLNTWGDLLLSATRKAIEKAMLNNVHFRKAVPRDFMNFAGVTASEESTGQKTFVARLKKLAAKAMEYLDPDEAADAHALRFIRCSLPPIFNKIEQERSIHGNGSCWKNEGIRLKSPIELDTEVRIIRKRNQRLIIDESGPKIFHNLENNRDPKDLEEEGQEGVYIDFDMEGVPAFTYLLQKHPTFVKVIDLPIGDTDDRISFATSLYENGLLMTKYPLPTLKDDDWIRIPDEAVIKIEKDD